ncbi:LPS translocon maturation chaperone LptM [Steroidobacter denitrificans]|uniref:LPS translocon maturation chaperone LptM n=1 Tax=Steroidobacter denitrificans TaxID=465721 RepID=UPI0012EDE3D3|nr:lipoprotein [Steroidobacter denitrificans]
MSHRHARRLRHGQSRSLCALVAAAFPGVLALLLAGCGLKGPLYLPEGRDQTMVPMPAEEPALIPPMPRSEQDGERIPGSARPDV